MPGATVTGRASIDADWDKLYPNPDVGSIIGFVEQFLLSHFWSKEEDIPLFRDPFVIGGRAEVEIGRPLGLGHPTVKAV